MLDRNVIFIFFLIFFSYTYLSAETNSYNNKLDKETNIKQLPPPIIAPEKKIFTSSSVITLVIPCSENCCQQAQIKYTLDGSNPRKSSTVQIYTKPIIISQTLKIRAYSKSTKRCGEDSKIITKEYRLIEPLPIPKVTPAQPSIPRGQYITISVEGFENHKDIEIYYTIDGQDPSTTGLLYDKPFPLNKNCILRVIAISKSGQFLNSPVLLREYNCRTNTWRKPKIIPVSTHFKDKIEIAIIDSDQTPDKSVSIYYTLDGSDPTAAGAIYQSPINLSKTSIVKALAIKPGYYPSKISSELFVKGSRSVATKPHVTPSGGIYRDSIPSIQFSTSVPDAMILYTLDGTEPNMASTLWNNKPFKITGPCILKAKTYKTDWLPSVTIVEQYDYETLPKPVANYAHGTVFSDSLKLNFYVPDFYKRKDLMIFYTLDGSDPFMYGMLYDTNLTITYSCLVKTFARLSGFYDSDINTYEFFHLNKVSHAYYKDQNRDSRIETVVLHFKHPIQNYPSIIEFSDPFTGHKYKIESSHIIPDDQISSVMTMEINLPHLFSEGGAFSAGHYGRIPLPGEFDTAPFLIYDSTKHIVASIKPEVSNQTININGITFNNNDIAVITNPFFPGLSRLPLFIQELDDYKTETGSAVIVRPPHPSRGYGVIYDALGNQVIAGRKMIEDPSTGLLVLVWDGKNIRDQIVNQGTYLVVITIEEKQSSRTYSKQTRIAVKRK